MQTKIINLVGSPGVGKSVCASLVFAELKIRGYTAEYVQEFAKTLVWKNEIDSLKNQEFIARQQFDWINLLYNKVEYIVTDSPLFLGLYYNQLYNKNNELERFRVQNIILDNMNQFNKNDIYILLERGEFEYEQSGRVQTLEQSNEIQNELKKLLKQYTIPFVTFRSDKNNIHNIVEYIINLENTVV